MGRVTVLLLLLLVAGAINPTLRAAADPYTRPYLDRALSPVYEWQTRYRVKEIARGLHELSARGRPLPEPAEFPRFLRDFYRGTDPEIDAWGNPLFLSVAGTEAYVGSAGRDGTRGTPDDLFSAAVPVRRR